MLMSTILHRLEQLERETKLFGFYWNNSTQILQQIISECDEIREHLKSDLESLPMSSLEEEIGDLLHAAVSLCIYYQLNPEKTLTKAIDKFENRFNMVKRLAGEQGLQSVQGLSFQTLMNLWNEAKIRTSSLVKPPAQSEIDPAFMLDPCLVTSCFVLVDWPLSRVLLKNNAEYPWFILVPKRHDLMELTQLSPDDQSQLMIEINQLCKLVRDVFQPDKLNMGALGNIVKQFHYHVVGRFINDALWPQGVWQQATIDTPYVDPEPLIKTLQEMLMRI